MLITLPGPANSMSQFAALNPQGQKIDYIQQGDV